MYGTYMGSAATRAGYEGIITTTELKNTATGKAGESGFAVFGFYTGTSQMTFDVNKAITSNVKPNFMYNQQVTWDGSSKWTYTPVKFWPNGIDAANAASSPSNTATEAAPQYLSFYAYAPYVAVTQNGSDQTQNATATGNYGIINITGNNAQNDPKITYKFKDGSTTWDLTAANNVDLLWGMAGSHTGKSTYDETDNTDQERDTTEYNVNLTKQSTAETVDFYFKHALAKFGGRDNNKSYFKVVADIDGNSANPETAGLPTKDGTTLITLTEVTITSGTEANNILGGGIFDIATGKWANTSPSPTYIDANTTLKTSVYNAETITDLNTAVWEPKSTTPSYTSSAWNPTGVTTDLQDVYSANSEPFYLIPGVANQTLQIKVSYIVRTYDANLNASASGEANGTWTKVPQTITNNVTLADLEPNKVYTLVMHLGLTSVKFSAEVANWQNKSDDQSADNIKVVWLPSNVVVTP